MAGPMEGVRVVEIGVWVAGPAAGTWHLLVDRVAGVGAVQLAATVIGD